MLILKDPSWKALQKQLLSHGIPTNLSGIYPTITKFRIYATFRIKGKKQSSNFLARYKYGNGKEKGIKNMHVNIRSLRYKIQEVKNIIQDHSPHILGASEAELKKVKTDVNSLKIPGYKILFPKSWESNGFARVIVYVKNTFKHEHLEVLECDSVSHYG